MFDTFTLWFQINGATGTWWSEVCADTAPAAAAVWYNGGYYRSFDSNTVQNFAPDVIDANLLSYNTIWSARVRAFRLYCYAYTGSAVPLAYIIGEYL